MAIFAALIGGTLGFLSFIMAWLGLGYGILPALGIYLTVGFGCTCLLIAYGQTARSQASLAAPAHLAILRQDPRYNR